MVMAHPGRAHMMLGEKKKRESKGNETHRKKKSHKRHKILEENERSNSSSHKNLMQLAKLVQAGSLSMPRGLDAYFDDRPSLLDQLFTILTQEDIQGLLPDILKGLKTKKIKELCLRELTKLDDSQLLSIITDTQEEEKEEEKEEEEEDEEEREMDEGVNEATCTTTIYEQSSSEEEGQISPCRHRPPPPPPPPPLSPPPINSNEISEEEESTRQSHDERSRDQSSKSHDDEHEDQNLIIEIGSDIEDQHTPEEGKVRDDIEEIERNDEVERNEEIERNEEEQQLEIYEDSEKEQVHNDDDDGWSEDITEQQKLLEMKIRKRLLENQVKRLQEKPHPPPEPPEPQEIKKQKLQEEDKVPEQSITSSKLLEMRLREKAIKSLLSKKELNKNSSK